MVEHCLHSTLATMHLLVIHFLSTFSALLPVAQFLEYQCIHHRGIQYIYIKKIEYIYLVIENGLSFWSEINKVEGSSSNCSYKTNEETEVL